MGIDADDELRLLRARAYGPDADISDDPGALERLRELEAARTPPLAEVGAPARRDDVESWPVFDTATDEVIAARDEDESASDVTEDATVSAAEEGASAARPSRRRRVALMWTASVVVAATVSAAVAVFATRQFQDDARPVATLGADTEFVWPRAFGGPERAGDAYDVFHGIRPLTTDDARRTGASDECLFLLSDDLIDDSDYYSGSIWASGCGAGAFPATVAMKVTAGMPEELRARFPIGTSLQFTLADGEISVQRAWGPVSYFGDPDPAETR